MKASNPVTSLILTKEGIRVYAVHPDLLEPGAEIPPGKVRYDEHPARPIAKKEHFGYSDRSLMRKLTRTGTMKVQRGGSVRTDVISTILMSFGILAFRRGE